MKSQCFWKWTRTSTYRGMVWINAVPFLKSLDVRFCQFRNPAPNLFPFWASNSTWRTLVGAYLYYSWSYRASCFINFELRLPFHWIFVRRIQTKARPLQCYSTVLRTTRRHVLFCYKCRNTFWSISRRLNTFDGQLFQYYRKQRPLMDSVLTAASTAREHVQNRCSATTFSTDFQRPKDQSFVLFPCF